MLCKLPRILWREDWAVAAGPACPADAGPKCGAYIKSEVRDEMALL